jgi:glutathione synthase/RimK-type ligase-like ATP-grasp enzyme
VEYFDYSLFRQDINYEEKSRFIGWAGERGINDYFNRSRWSAVSLDKILFYTILKGAGIPFPSVLAIYSPENARTLEGTPTFDSVAGILSWLEQELSFHSLFVKPSHGGFGRGSFLLTSIHKATRQIETSAGTLGADEFVAGLETKLSHGYLFQDYINPHETISLITDGKTSTIRIALALIEDTYAPISAVWKIPTGRNHIDNFQHGRTGNLVASIDVESGVVMRLARGNGRGGTVSIQANPENARSVVGLELPMWRDTIELCRAAARVIPGLHLLHFDVAISPQGPLMVEVNYEGNMDLHQHASGRGFLSDRLKEAMEAERRHQAEIQRIVQMTRVRERASSGA